MKARLELIRIFNSTSSFKNSEIQKDNQKEPKSNGLFKK